MEKLSIVILTKNVDHVIERCLKAVQGLSDDIVIFDGASTDNTIPICKRYTSQIYSLSDPESKITGAELNNRALAKAKHDWVFKLDADEIVSPGLKKEIQQLLNKGTAHAGFYIKRRDHVFLNTYITTSLQLRLYRKSKSAYKYKIHEQLLVSGPTTTLTGTMDHYSYKDVTDYVERFQRYTTIEAKGLYEQQPHKSDASILANALIRPPIEFFLWYIGKGLWRRGLVAFFYACCSGFYQFVKYLKYYELKHQKKYNAEHK